MNFVYESPLNDRRFSETIDFEIVFVFRKYKGNGLFKDKNTIDK